MPSLARHQCLRTRSPAKKNGETPIQSAHEPNNGSDTGTSSFSDGPEGHCAHTRKKVGKRAQAVPPVHTPVEKDESALIASAKNGEAQALKSWSHATSEGFSPSRCATRAFDRTPKTSCSRASKSSSTSTYLRRSSFSTCVNAGRNQRSAIAAAKTAGARSVIDDLTRMRKPQLRWRSQDRLQIPKLLLTTRVEKQCCLRVLSNARVAQRDGENPSLVACDQDFKRLGSLRFSGSNQSGLILFYGSVDRRTACARFPNFLTSVGTVSSRSVTKTRSACVRSIVWVHVRSELVSRVLFAGLRVRKH